MSLSTPVKSKGSLSPKIRPGEFGDGQVIKPMLGVSEDHSYQRSVGKRQKTTGSCRWDVFRCFVEMWRFLRCHSVPCGCCACSALFVGHGCEAALCDSHLLWPQLTSQHLVYLSAFSDVLSGYLPNTCQGFPALYPTLTLSSAVCVCMYVCMHIYTHILLLVLVLAIEEVQNV